MHGWGLAGPAPDWGGEGRLGVEHVEGGAMGGWLAGPTPNQGVGDWLGMGS